MLVLAVILSCPEKEEFPPALPSNIKELFCVLILGVESLGPKKVKLPLTVTF